MCGALSLLFNRAALPMAYVVFGFGDTRSWDDARSHRFISAGGADWYSRTLKGVGVSSRAPQSRPTNVTVDGGARDSRPLPLQDSYRHPQTGQDVDAAEYIVPVQWLQTVSMEDAVWRQGIFANQDSAGKLRNQFTIDELTREFKLTDLL